MLMPRFAVTLAIISVMAPAFNAHATLVTINFESDAAGARPNGFSSVDSSLVTFTDSIGADLLIGNFGIASIGNGLAVGTNDNSLLIMSFSVLADSLSLAFGNDDPAFSAFGDFARLSLYLNNVLVDFDEIQLNRNTAMDQTISLSGTLFNSATLEYYVSSDGLTKTVDNIVFNTVPGPEVLGILTAGSLIGFRRRRS